MGRLGHGVEGWLGVGRLGKEAGGRLLPCVCIIGTRLPVEYMANGMAF